MGNKTNSKQKTTEFVIWLLGMLGILFVIMNQNAITGVGYDAKPYFPYLLIVSMALISLSLILKLIREKKSHHFSLSNHARDIIRTAGGLAFAIYALVQNG